MHASMHSPTHPCTQPARQPVSQPDSHLTNQPSIPSTHRSSVRPPNSLSFQGYKVWIYSGIAKECNALESTEVCRVSQQRQWTSWQKTTLAFFQQQQRRSDDKEAREGSRPP